MNALQLLLSASITPSSTCKDNTFIGLGLIGVSQISGTGSMEEKRRVYKKNVCTIVEGLISLSVLSDLTIEETIDATAKPVTLPNLIKSFETLSARLMCPSYTDEMLGVVKCFCDLVQSPYDKPTASSYVGCVIYDLCQLPTTEFLKKYQGHDITDRELMIILYDYLRINPAIHDELKVQSWKLV